MTFPYLTRGHAPASGAGAALVSALIVLLALLALPYHFAGTEPADKTQAGETRTMVEDWRGNSAGLRPLD